MKPAATPEPPVWRALVGDYPNTHALKAGRVSSPAVRLTFADVPVPNRAFKRVVRDLEFDVAELALMTFLMARAAARPLVLLPVVLFSRNPLPYLVCRAAPTPVGPRDLAGRRIGVRSYTTTTAAWLRGILHDQYAIVLDGIEWVTLEEAHVAEFADPPNVRRAPAGSDLRAMLLAGDIDAAIVDPVPSDPGIVPVVPDAGRVFSEWRQRRQAVPINHVVVVNASLPREHPDLVAAVHQLFAESRRLAGSRVDPASIPIGLDAMRSSLEVAIEYAGAQHLLARPLEVDELVNEASARG